MATKRKENSKVKEAPEESVTDAEERAIKLVTACKKESLEFYEEKFKQFNYYDRLYVRGASKTNVPYGRANLELPLAFQQVEPFVDQMTETMVGEAPYIAYSGRNEEDDQAAQEITDFSQYQLECGNFLPSWTSFCRTLAKCGNAVMKVNWETDIIEVEEEVEVPIIEKVINPATGQLEDMQTGVKIEVQNEDFTKHDGPVFYNLSLFDFFVPRSASSPDVQKMPWVIHRTYRTLDQLLENPNYKRAHDRIKKIQEEEESEADNESGSNIGDIREQARRASMDLKNPSQGSKKFQGKIEILEWWGDYKFKKTERAKPALIAIAVLEGEKICLRLDTNPFKFKFKPFLMTNDYQVEGEPYGYGELHHIKGLIEESTALRNARLDVANISLNRVWLVERQAGVNLRELYTAPNKVILTNDLNGLKPMDMGNVTPSSVNELARIDFDIQNTTEIINPRQDISSVGAAFGGTATGVNFMSGKANRRLMTKARLLEETFFKPMAQMLNWFNKDLVTDNMYYRVAGTDNPNPYGKEISPEALLTPVDYKPSSNPSKLTVGEKKDNMAYLLQTLATIEKASPGVNNWYELLKDIHKLAGHPHPEKYVNPPQTTIMQTPDGQILDNKGQPVQVVPVDEMGKPVEASQGETPQGGF